MSSQITFSSPPVATAGLPDQYYIFQADISSGELYSDIGGLVKSAAEANASGLDYLGAIQKPGLVLEARLLNLWLIFKDASSTASSTYTIVIDLDEELQLIDPDKLGVLGELIDADVRIKFKRIVYSHNLDPDFEGLSRDDVLQETPHLYWPNEFTAGIYGEFSLCIGDEIEEPFRLLYSVKEYDKWGNVKPDPNQEEEDDGEEDAGDGETPGEEENADNKGQSETKNMVAQERTPVFSLDELLITFKGEGLSLVIDASIAIGPLTGKLINFELDIDFTDMSIRPSIRGVGVGYDSPPISVAGALIKTNDDEYNGGLAIGLTAWNMVALGSIGMVEVDGLEIPSVFVYGYLGGELVNIEGIASITGLAATMGLNRKLKTITDMGEVPDHPLIKAAASSPAEPIKLDGLVKMLKSLNKYVPRQAGSFFFGVGMKGEVVELISLYALPVLTLEFSLDEFPPSVEDVKIQIFGLGSAALPQGSTVVELELAVQGNFSIKDQEVLIGGALTNNSGIKITPDLKLDLSGGFAFYFAPDIGGSKPAYVFTIGGYGRLLTPDPNWPVVPPLSLTWSPTDNIDVTADFYFAVTSKCLALGFAIDGSAEYGGKWFSAGASFDIGLDFLIQWAPFLYKGEIHADFHAYVKAWLVFTTAEQNFDIQAQANIWGGEGKEVSGSAELHVHLLFSINLSVEWGDAETEPQPISWGRFRQSFLPEENSNNQLPLSSLKITKGIVGTLKGNDGKQYSIVRADLLEIRVDSLVPSTSISYNGTAQDLNGNEANVGIGTMGYTSALYRANVAPELSVSLKKDDVQVPQGSGDGEVKVAVVNGDVSASLWKPAAEMFKVAEVDSFSDYQIRDVPKGLSIQSNPPIEGGKFDIDKSALEFDVSQGRGVEAALKEQLPIGTKQTEGAIASSMVNHPPDPGILAALGITEAPVFTQLKETDLEAIPYLV